MHHSWHCLYLCAPKTLLRTWHDLRWKADADIPFDFIDVTTKFHPLYFKLYTVSPEMENFSTYFRLEVTIHWHDYLNDFLLRIRTNRCGGGYATHLTSDVFIKESVWWTETQYKENKIPYAGKINPENKLQEQEPKHSTMSSPNQQPTRRPSTHNKNMDSLMNSKMHESFFWFHWDEVYSENDRVKLAIGVTIQHCRHDADIPATEATSS